MELETDETGTTQPHDHSTPVNTATMSMKASTRVFALNELLEQILLKLADALQFYAEASSGPPIPQPAIQLFVLQRTNSHFRDTIRRSKVMQRRMFSESPATPESTSEAEVEGGDVEQAVLQDHPESHYEPLLWMVDWMELFRGDWYLMKDGDDEYEVLELRNMYRMHPVYFPKAIKPDFQAKCATAEASWRGIPITATPDRRELMVKYQLSVEGGHTCFWRAQALIGRHPG